MADKEQNTELTQEDQVFLDRVGIVLKGAKEIAAHMRVSPATIVRWRMRFRGREEVRLCFPAFLVPTGKGNGLKLWSHTAWIRLGNGWTGGSRLIVRRLKGKGDGGVEAKNETHG